MKQWRQLSFVLYILMKIGARIFEYNFSVVWKQPFITASVINCDGRLRSSKVSPKWRHSVICVGNFQLNPSVNYKPNKNNYNLYWTYSIRESGIKSSVQLDKQFIWFHDIAKYYFFMNAVIWCKRWPWKNSFRCFDHSRTP